MNTFQLTQMWQAVGISVVLFSRVTCAAESAPTFPAGLSAAEDGSKSADDYRNAAKAGDREALVQLGYCYEFGSGGVAKDLAIAVRCFEEAGRLGSAVGMFQTALCNAAGMGGVMNKDKAMEWMRRSAQAGYEPARLAMTRLPGNVWIGEFDYMRRVTSPSARFGSDATRLFQAVSSQYILNEVSFPEIPSLELIEKAARSSDQLLANIARGYLEERSAKTEFTRLTEEANKAAGDTQRRLRNALPSFFLSDQDPMDSANELLSKTMKPQMPGDGDLQETLNRTWRLQVRIQLGLQDLREKIRRFADRSDAIGAKVPDALGVRMTTLSATLAGIAVTNRTNKPLSHCLLISRQQPRPKDNKGEFVENAPQRIAKVLNDSVGIDEDITKNSMRGEALRKKIMEIEHGYVAYIPVIPAGVTVTIPLCDPTFLGYGPRVDVALWCDELTAESPRATNFQEVQIAYQQSLKAAERSQSESKPAAPPGSPGLGNRTNPLDPKASQRSQSGSKLSAPPRTPGLGGLGNWDNPLDHPARSR